jgi:hypothetical protein
MTEFTVEMRHYCRNPRCRSKLPAPVSNAREAFCCRGCHGSFYRHRCLICEQPMERKTENQLICGKRKCRNALVARSGLGRYLPSSDVISPSKKPVNKGLEGPPTDGRPWRVIAGPELTPDQLHGATVPDGPNCRWEGGAYLRIEANNRAMLRRHFRDQAAKCLLQPHHSPVNIVGGYRFPDARVIDLSPSKAVAPQLSAVEITGDGLDIPAFLRRAPQWQPARLAA